jgi:hypothetical protein
MILSAQFGMSCFVAVTLHTKAVVSMSKFLLFQFVTGMIHLVREILHSVCLGIESYCSWLFCIAISSPAQTELYSKMTLMTFQDGDDESADLKRRPEGRASTTKRTRAAEVHNLSERVGFNL